MLQNKKSKEKQRIWQNNNHKKNQSEEIEEYDDLESSPDEIETEFDDTMEEESYTTRNTDDLIGL